MSSPFGALYSDLYDPAFPGSPLGAAVELYLGSAMGWTDISKQVYQRDPIHITDGRPDESSTVDPSQCTLTLNNRDNRFSINNPMSPYHGLLTRNTPLRVSVPNSLLPAPYNGSYLRLEDDTASYASCPDASGLHITGDIEVRVDTEITSYGNCVLAAKRLGTADWALVLTSEGQLLFEWFEPSGDFNSAVSTLPITVAERQAFRVTLEVSTATVTFSTAPSIDGMYTQLGDAYSTTGGVATTILTSSGPIKVGYNTEWANEGAVGLQGGVREFRLYNGIGGTLVADAVFASQTAGATSWTDAQGNPWSLSGTAEISDRCYRYHGELSQTPKACDPTGQDVYSNAGASGILRRLQQAQSPISSPLYRAYVRLAGSLAPVAYWPCEDASQATQIASGLPDGLPMKISGTPQMSSNSDFICSAPIPVLNGSTWTGTVPAGSWSANVVRLLFEAPSTGDTAGVIARVYTTGTAALVELVYNSGGTGSFTLNAYDNQGNSLASMGPLLIVQPSGAAGGCNGFPLRLDVDLQIVGGSIQLQLQSYAIGAGVGGFNTTTFSGSIGAVTRVAINPNGSLAQSAVGHVSVQSAWDSLFDLLSALNAWVGESAANRVIRLCTEEGIPYRIIGHPDLAVPMGPQTQETIPELLQECETTDRGLLFEPMTALGIGYRTLNSMCNQDPVVTADYSAAQLGAAFSSTADDLLSLNDVTATNLDGSSARVVLETGTMSVQPPPDGIGRVDTAIQVNAGSDDYLPGIANWILHVSTDGHDRFPAIPFNMARSQTPPRVPLARIGDLAAIENAPLWLQPDEIRQLVAGRSETLGPASVWEIDLNGIPAYPYLIAEVDGGGGLATHVDTDGSQLAILAVAGGAPTAWKKAADWATWGGTNATVAASGNALQITSSGAGTFWQGYGPTSPVTAGQTVAVVARITALQALGSVSAGVHLGGGSDTFTASTALALAAGQTVTVCVSATAAPGQTYWQPYVIDNETVAAGEVMLVSLVYGAVTGSLSVATTSPYPIWTTDPADFPFDLNIAGERVTTVAASGSTSPQAFTVIRAVNGVSKSQPAGTSVALWYTPIVGQITGV